MRGKHVQHRRSEGSRKHIAWGTTLVTALALVAIQLPAVAVHTYDFMELDRNAIDDNLSDAIVDWENIGTGNFIETAFIADPPTAAGADDIYTIGSTKDDLDLDGWHFKTGNVPDKDDLTNAYAAAISEDSELVLYFGADRYANRGDADIGFWFLQQSVHMIDGGFMTPDPITGTFIPATHQIGDILVLSDFTGGGKVSTIKVYMWVGTGGDTNGTLNLIAEGADCVDQGSGLEDYVCGTVNVDTEVAPWPFTPKFPDKTVDYNHFPSGSFYEGGVNLTALGVDAGCFSTFIAETRSSQSVDAILKDVVLGRGDLCSIDVEKEGPELSKIGDEATYTYDVTNTGALPLYLDTILDSQIGDLVPFATPDCDVLAPAESCTFTVPWVIPEGADDPYVNEVTVVYRDFITPGGDPYGSSIVGSAEWAINLFQPDYELTKTGDELSKAGDEVTYTFELMNLSSDDSPDLILESMSDNVLGDLMTPAAAAGCDVLAFNELCSFDIAYTIPDDAPDPLDNTVVAVMSPDGFPNELERRASHSLNLFQPDFSIDKTGDTLSKIGDDVTYTFTVTNLSSDDAPMLELLSMNDTVLGDLTTTANAAGCASLAFGETCSFNVVYTVPDTAPDPLINTVTAVMSPNGFPNELSRSDTHEVNLFQPSIEIEKLGDELSKIGDSVEYSLTLFNTSSPDTPPMLCTITDPMLGVNQQELLASGTSMNWLIDYIVPDDASDPLVNTATATCSPTGFPNVLTATSTWSTNLFQPGIEVTKTGTELSKIGDEVTYMFRIDNTSSTDAPRLELIDMTDTVVGDLTAIAGAAGCDWLASGDYCMFSVTFLVPDDAEDPMHNHVHVIMSPEGFPNLIEGGADHEVNLFQPDYELVKTGTELSKIGDDVTYRYTLTNLSSTDSPDLELLSMADSEFGSLMAEAATAGCDVIASGETCWFEVVYEVPADAPDPLINIVDAVMSPLGFPNELERTDSHEVNLFQPNYELVCATAAAAYFVFDDVCYEFTVTNLSSADTPPLVLMSASDTLLGNVSGAFATAGADVLDFGESQTVMVYRTVMGTDPTPLVNTLTTVYSPDGFPNLLERSTSCEFDILYGCALSPGFWGGGEGEPKWDEALDPVAIAAGFTTGDVFPWLDPSLAGSTYYETLKLPALGDVTQQLAFKYIAASLNEAAPGIGVPADVALLLDDIEVYFAAHPVGSDPQGAAGDMGKALKTALDTYFSVVGEDHCPSPDTIPEY